MNHSESESPEHKVAYAAHHVALSVSAVSALAQKHPNLVAKDVLALHEAERELHKIVSRFMPGLHVVSEAAE